MKPPSRQGIQIPRLPKRLQPAALDALTDHAEYSGVALSGANLAEQAAAGVLFEQVHLRHVVMAQTRLSRPRLLDVRFDGCDLSAADWEKAHVRRTEFADCRLLSTSFFEARIEDVWVEGCNAEGAQFVSAVFRAVRFERCTLRAASFVDADLTGVVLHECDLSLADLRGAKLEGADLRGSRLEGMQVSPAGLKGVIIGPAQAVEIASLLGLIVKQDGD